MRAIHRAILQVANVEILSRIRITITSFISFFYNIRGEKIESNHNDNVFASDIIDIIGIMS